MSPPSGPAWSVAVILLNVTSIQADAGFSVLRWTALVIFIVIIGGVGSPAGPIFGVLGFWLIDEQLGDADAWRFIILGIIAMVMAVLAPKGIDGLLQRLRPTQLFPLQRRLELGVAADDSGGGGGSAVAASTGTASE